jgi:SAM-dependent methyltransferase
VCLEPDIKLANKLRTSLLKEKKSKNISTIHGKISALDRNEQFDTIIYIDVLEHIDDDKGELRKASEHLRPGGNMIVLSPAHQSLYTEFDRAIGHMRRYSKQTIKDIVPANLKFERLVYLDSIGVFASFANKVFMKQSIPSERQIKFWDQIMIPISKFTDRLLNYGFGKSVLAILNKPE